MRRAQSFSLTDKFMKRPVSRLDVAEAPISQGAGSDTKLYIT